MKICKAKNYHFGTVVPVTNSEKLKFASCRLKCDYSDIRSIEDCRVTVTEKAKEVIFPHIDAGKEVHLNLSNVQYMDSSGISVLIESHQKGLEKGTKVIIKDVSKSVLKVIMMAKLEQILNLE